MRLRLLGSVTATASGRDIAIGGPRARALLAALALAGGRTLPAETLLREVWGRTGDGVRSALRANISRMRATPLGAYLIGGRDGYALAADLDVDLWRIEHATLDELALVVDAVPYDGCGTSPFLEPARATARTAVRGAAVRAIDAQPRHPLAVPTTERLLAQAPHDPELRALLMSLREGALAIGPAPATATRRIGLPAPIAVYLRRPEDEGRLAAALRLSRLVTLAGPPGAGKSRLAIEWARGAGGSSQEHVWFCHVGGRTWLAELAAVVGAEAHSIGDVIAHMRTLRGTIVLDGLDDAPDADALATLLTHAPGITALVTARRSLDIPGESVHRIGALAPADARALFALRAGLEFETDDVDAVMAAYGRLPLAIELTAARAAQTPTASLIDALRASVAPNTDPLEAALDATLAMLSEPEHAALFRLHAFRGPFARDSAYALAEATDPQLDALLGWSLVVEESFGALAMLRIPEVVRRRVRAAEPVELRTRHATWFAARTLSAFDELTSHRAAIAWQRLSAERDDIDAAFAHALDVGDRGSALSIAAGMTWAGLMSGTQRVVLAMSRRAAAVPGRATDDVETCAVLGRGILAYQLGHMSESEAALAEALRYAESSGNADLIALTHGFSAYLATLAPSGTRDAVHRIGMAQKSAENCSPSTRAMVTLISSQVARSRGDRANALALARSAHEIAVPAGHRWVVLMSDVVAAKVRVDERDARGALAHLRRAIADPGVLTDPISVLIAASVAAGAAAAAGADAAGARIIGGVDAIGPRYGFDPRANEPADFERYRLRVRQALSADAWRDAYGHGTALTLSELVEETLRIGGSGVGRPTRQ